MAELEPVHLEKRIALSESELDNESPIQSSMATESQAQNLLKLVKTETQSDSSNLNADTLLLDLCKEGIMVERHENPNADEIKQDLIRVAEDWMSERHRDLLLGWEVQNNRKAYIMDMEESGKWRELEEEKEEVAAEVESEVLTSLLNEMLLELTTT